MKREPDSNLAWLGLIVVVLAGAGFLKYGPSADALINAAIIAAVLLLPAVRRPRGLFWLTLALAVGAGAGLALHRLSVWTHLGFWPWAGVLVLVSYGFFTFALRWTGRETG